MKNKKIFSFDLDGTLLNSKGEISKETLKALKKAKESGVILSMNSGRGFHDMIGLLKSTDFLFDFLICNNGAYFYETKRNKHHHFSGIDKKIIIKAREIASPLKPVFALHTVNGVYRNEEFIDNIPPKWFTEKIADEWKRIHKTIYSNKQLDEKMEEELVTQVAFRADKQTIKELHELLKHLKKDIEIHISGEVYLDINPLNTNKFVGLQRLCEYIDADVQNVYAFGDSGNDLAMLEGAGWGIAMSNGTEEAKKAANEVIGDHNSDAISKKIIEIINSI